jgi:hypothetical protein
MKIKNDPPHSLLASLSLLVVYIYNPTTFSESARNTLHYFATVEFPILYGGLCSTLHLLRPLVIVAPPFPLKRARNIQQTAVLHCCWCITECRASRKQWSSRPRAVHSHPRAISRARQVVSINSLLKYLRQRSTQVTAMCDIAAKHI